MRTENPRDCPVRGILGRISDKWSVLVLLHLSRGTRLRFAQLRREIDDISQRMLSVTLRKLEREGLVERTVTPTTPPRVDYALTGLGRSLIGHFDRLASWASKNQAAIETARGRFDGAAARRTG